MSAMSFAKQAYSAFNREKPHSSITELVEILTSASYEEETYDGIPELVESINIQGTGPPEASRSIRKKLKHGDPHQQYRALVILRALVENGGQKFKTTFADTQLTDAIKTLAQDPATDPKVKRKLLSVLASWSSQFKDEPSMSSVAGLYKLCKPGDSRTRMRAEDNVLSTGGLDFNGDIIGRKKKEEGKRKEEQKGTEKPKTKRDDETRRRRGTQGNARRRPFNFEQEKPQILTTIASASQASNNLVNAITLVNTDQESLQTNNRVQECLEQAKTIRKKIVKYIQLVENEDTIGILIETNERVIDALEMYEALSNSRLNDRDTGDTQERMAATTIYDPKSGRLQETQCIITQHTSDRSGVTIDAEVHPDLQDLSFGPLGTEHQNLPPPMRPTTSRYSSDEDVRRGSLSDYSDYESSDEETHNRASSSGAQAKKSYVAVSDNDGETDIRKDPKHGLLRDDPFADPFGDP